MTPSNRLECEMRTALPASLPAVEEFFMEFRLKYAALLNREQCFAVELLLREALTNAVAHGCHADPDKLVHCLLRLKNRRLLIIVQDAGDGFDWRAARRKPSEFTDCSGRGIRILRKYANHVRYNGPGNVVAMVKRLCC
jgi:anti-sigma regulatory factor (Ser/Thr protein kinase)